MTSTPARFVATLQRLTRPGTSDARTAGRARAAEWRRARDALGDRNVVGVGIGAKCVDGVATGALGLCIYVERKLPRSRLRGSRTMPPVLDADDGHPVPTDVKVIGRLAPESRPASAPIVSGRSISHARGKSGTLGAIVRRGRRLYALGNAHVLACDGFASIDDDILCPGRREGGRVARDRLGRLADFVPFRKGTRFVNRVDAALAEIDPSRLGDLDFSLHGVVGAPRTIAPRRGMTVFARGCQSGETQGVIEDVHFRFVMDYDRLRDVRFTGQVLCSRFTRAGDSGALVVDAESGRIVGLHFAGAAGGSVFNPIGPVMERLGFRFATR